MKESPSDPVATIERRVGLAARRTSSARIFARIEPWITAGQIDGRRRPGTRANKTCRSAELPCRDSGAAAARVNALRSRISDPQGVDLDMSGPGVTQSGVEQNHRELRPLAAGRTNLARR